MDHTRTDDEKPFITLEIDSIVYQGVIVEMLDDASNETLSFTAIGTNNESIWGVLYRECCIPVELDGKCNTIDKTKIHKLF